MIDCRMDSICLKKFTLSWKNSNLLSCIVRSVPLPNIILTPSVTHHLIPLQIANANFFSLIIKNYNKRNMLILNMFYDNKKNRKI